jgi:hypothetical protein
METSIWPPLQMRQYWNLNLFRQSLIVPVYPTGDSNQYCERCATSNRLAINHLAGQNTRFTPSFSDLLKVSLLIRPPDRR